MKKTKLIYALVIGLVLPVVGYAQPAPTAAPAAMPSLNSPSAQELQRKLIIAKAEGESKKLITGDNLKRIDAVMKSIFLLDEKTLKAVNDKADELSKAVSEPQKDLSTIQRLLVEMESLSTQATLPMPSAAPARM